MYLVKRYIYDELEYPRQRDFISDIIVFVFEAMGYNYDFKSYGLHVKHKTLPESHKYWKIMFHWKSRDWLEKCQTIAECLGYKIEVNDRGVYDYSEIVRVELWKENEE